MFKSSVLHKNDLHLYHGAINIGFSSLLYSDGFFTLIATIHVHMTVV